MSVNNVNIAKAISDIVTSKLNLITYHIDNLKTESAKTDYMVPVVYVTENYGNSFDLTKFVPNDVRYNPVDKNFIVHIGGGTVNPGDIVALSSTEFRIEGIDFEPGMPICIWGKSQQDPILGLLAGMNESFQMEADKTVYHCDMKLDGTKPAIYNVLVDGSYDHEAYPCDSQGNAHNGYTNYFKITRPPVANKHVVIFSAPIFSLPNIGEYLHPYIQECKDVRDSFFSDLMEIPSPALCIDGEMGNYPFPVLAGIGATYKDQRGLIVTQPSQIVKPTHVNNRKGYGIYTPTKNLIGDPENLHETTTVNGITQNLLGEEFITVNKHRDLSPEGLNQFTFSAGPDTVGWLIYRVRKQDGSSFSKGVYTFSAYVENTDSHSRFVDFNNDDAHSSIDILPHTRQFVTLKLDLSEDTPMLDIEQHAVDDKLIFSRMQIEKQPIATPYTNAGSRSAIDLIVPTKDWFNPGEGTFVVTFEKLGTESNRIVFSIGPTTENSMYVRTGIDWIDCRCGEHMESLKIPNGLRKIVVRYSKNKYEMFYDGVRSAAITPLAQYDPLEWKDLHFGRISYYEGNYLNSVIYDFTYYANALSDAQCEYLTQL